MPKIGVLKHMRWSGPVGLPSEGHQGSKTGSVRAAKKRKKRRLSTLLTGPQGLLDPAMVQKKTLLGQ